MTAIKPYVTPNRLRPTAVAWGEPNEKAGQLESTCHVPEKVRTGTSTEDNP